MIGVVLVGLPLLAVGVAIRAFGPPGPIGPEHHPVLWLALSVGLASAFALAALGIAAAVRARHQAYARAVFRRVVERERDLLDEIERDLSWLDGEPATRTPGR